MAYDSTINGYTVDREYSTTVNLISKIPFVRSFTIHRADSNTHCLTINQNQLIGKYPTRDAALGALMGCMKAGGGSEDFALTAIEDMITKGRGKFTGLASQTIVLGFGGLYSVEGEVISSTGDEILATTHDATGSPADWWYTNSGGDSTQDKFRFFMGQYLKDNYGSPGTFLGNATGVVKQDSSSESDPTYSWKHEGSGKTAGADANAATGLYFEKFKATATWKYRLNIGGTWTAYVNGADTANIGGGNTNDAIGNGGSGQPGYYNTHVLFNDGTHGFAQTCTAAGDCNDSGTKYPNMDICVEGTTNGAVEYVFTINVEEIG